MCRALGFVIFGVEISIYVVFALSINLSIYRSSVHFDAKNILSLSLRNSAQRKLENVSFCSTLKTRERSGLEIKGR